jgi:hypothetical protein
VNRKQNRGRPPDEWDGAPTAGSADHHPNTTRHHPSGISHRSGHRPALGRYAAGWRHGFTAGAIDALRCAGRQLPPEAWNVLEELADAYELASADE